MVALANKRPARIPLKHIMMSRETFLLRQFKVLFNPTIEETHAFIVGMGLRGVSLQSVREMEKEESGSPDSRVHPQLAGRMMNEEKRPTAAVNV